jgi:hypothetical protein
MSGRAGNGRKTGAARADIVAGGGNTRRHFCLVWRMQSLSLIWRERRQGKEPRSIGCILGQSPIVIRRAVAPPNRATFAKRLLRLVNAHASCLQCFPVVCFQCQPDITARLHQQRHQPLPLGRGQCGIAAPPQPAPHHKVAAVGGDWKVHKRATLRFDQASINGYAC